MAITTTFRCSCCRSKSLDCAWTISTLISLMQYDDMMNSRKANELESRQEEPVLQSKKGEEGSRVDANEAGREEILAEKIARLERELAQRDRVIESLSVRYLLRNMPKMDVNPSCKPSTVENEKARGVVEEYRKSMLKWNQNMKRLKETSTLHQNYQEQLKKLHEQKPKRFEFHEPAKIVIDESFSRYMGFELNVTDGNGVPIHSSLLDNLSPTKMTLSHHNETSPQIYVRNAIMDVIRCYGVQAEVVMEATLFSLRPDILVVFYQGRLLFLFEIKNPPQVKSVDVFESETFAGQGFDYCSVLKQSGVDHPFVLLSTYNQSAIARFTNGDENAYRELLSKARAKLESLTREAKGRDKGSSEKKPPVSPVKDQLADLELPSLETKVDGMEVDDDDSSENGDDKCAGCEDSMDVEGDYDYHGREITLSETFDVNNLYKALALLLASSLLSAEASRESVQPLVPKPGADLGGRDLSTIYEDSFSFEKVRGKAPASYNVPPLFKPHQKFHVLCTLGQGSKGRCILCCSSSGKMFAAKLFLLHTSTHYEADDRQAALEAEFKEKEGKAKDEMGRWKAFALDHCHKYCKVLKLNGTPALAMPFFPPIPYGKRRDALVLIRKCLEKIAKQQKDDGKFYVYGEIRWRHFGCRWLNKKIEITPLGLGSLETVSSLEKAMETIDSQMEDLKKRIGEVIPPYTQTIIVK